MVTASLKIGENLFQWTEMKFFASRAFQPCNICCILKALQHFLIFLDRKNHRYGFAIFRDDLRLCVRLHLVHPNLPFASKTISTASFKFARASSSVAPCVFAPGSSSTNAAYPSGNFRKTAVSLISMSIL